MMYVHALYRSLPFSIFLLRRENPLCMHSRKYNCCEQGRSLFIRLNKLYFELLLVSMLDELEFSHTFPVSFVIAIRILSATILKNSHQRSSHILKIHHCSLAM